MDSRRAVDPLPEDAELLKAREVAVLIRVIFRAGSVRSIEESIGWMDDR
jgi:hypothetical protein